MNEEQFRAACVLLLTACVAAYGAWLFKTWQQQSQMEARQLRMFDMAIQADLARRIDNG